MPEKVAMSLTAMKHLIALSTAAVAACVIALMPFDPGRADDEATRQRYRDPGVSGGKQTFPDGAVITRLAWAYTPPEENNKVFGQQQSFVAGAPKGGVQFMVKDWLPNQKSSSTIQALQRASNHTTRSHGKVCGKQSFQF
jgi:hypothetical protein